MGGPNFIRHPGWPSVGCGQGPLGNGPTVLAAMTTIFEPVLTLPCGGDSSYGGMVWYDDLLWMSYYSSRRSRHEHNRAKVRL